MTRKSEKKVRKCNVGERREDAETDTLKENGKNEEQIEESVCVCAFVFACVYVRQRFVRLRVYVCIHVRMLLNMCAYVCVPVHMCYRMCSLAFV